MPEKSPSGYRLRSIDRVADSIDPVVDSDCGENVEEID